MITRTDIHLTPEDEITTSLRFNHEGKAYIILRFGYTTIFAPAGIEESFDFINHLQYELKDTKEVLWEQEELTS